MKRALHRKNASSCSTLCVSVFAAFLGLPAAADEPFYHQLFKAPSHTGYSPTRTFTIVTDAERGNQLVAEDDPDLQFNLMWMQQFQPGYKSRQGGAAFGTLFRNYVKSAYKSYREHNSQAFSALPDENGSIKVRSYSRDVDYRFSWNDGDVKLKINYAF